MMIKNMYKQPICINKWIEDLPNLQNLDDNQWKTIFRKPVKILANSRIVITQFKILHRLINCRKKLQEWKLADDSNTLPHIV